MLALEWKNSLALESTGPLPRSALHPGWGSTTGHQPSASKATGLCPRIEEKFNVDGHLKWCPAATPSIVSSLLEPREPPHPYLLFLDWGPVIHSLPSVRLISQDSYLLEAGVCVLSLQTSQQGGCQGSQHSARNHGTQSSHQSEDASDNHIPTHRNGTRRNGNLLLSLAGCCTHHPSHTPFQHST